VVVDEPVASNGYSTGMPGMDLLADRSGMTGSNSAAGVGDLAGDRFGVEAKPATIAAANSGP
jgi:hypothetical protein